MRGTIACTLGVVLGLAAVAESSDADRESPALRRFQNEYPAAFQRLRKFYTNLKMTAKQGREEHSHEWEFAAKDDNLRWVEGVSTWSGVPQQTPTIAIVARPDLAFTLQKQPGSSEYTIVRMGHPDALDVKGQSQSVLTRAPAASAPYCVLSEPIVDFLSGKNFKVKAAREAEDKDGNTITIEWENSPSSLLKRKGSFRFDAEHNWALKSYDFYFVDYKDKKTGELMDVGNHGKINYSGEKDGIPLLKFVETWTSGPEGESPRMTTEVTSFLAGPAPESDFDLESFGIHMDPSPLQSPVVGYLVALSAVCAAMSLLIRHVRSRAAQPS